MLTRNKHFVAFRTFAPDSSRLPIPSAARLVACAVGMELAGRTALLTGATGGLGRAIADGPRRPRGEAILSGRRPEALEALAAELPGEGHRALPADLAEPGAAEKLAAEAGEVDVLVANAGLPGTGRLTDFTAEELSGALRVNLEAPMLLARALEPAMLERGSGHLVFVSSLSGKSATPLTSVYNATKFGLRGFALACGRTWGRWGSASRSSPRGRSAKPGCSRTPAPRRRRPRHRLARAGRRRRRAGDRAQQGRGQRGAGPQRLLAHFALASPGIAVQDRQRLGRPEGRRGGRRRPVRQALTAPTHSSR